MTRLSLVTDDRGSLKYRLRTKCLTQALSGRANCVDEDAERGDKDEVLLAKRPLALMPEVIGFGR